MLSLLGLSGLAFAFTLGLHLGKDMSLKEALLNPLAKNGVAHVQDQSPGKTEISEHSAAVADSIDEVVQRNLHREVVRTGIKLDKSIPTQLPAHAASARAGATSLDRYSIQVGSHPTEIQAKRQLKSLADQGLHPRLIKAKSGYRVLIGGFLSRRLAEEMAGRYHKSGWISQYLVTRSPAGR